MKAKIFKPSKTAMQSGRANTKSWSLVLIEDSKTSKDGLMGWHGGSSTVNQVKLKFSTKEDAIDYAKRNNLSYEVLESSERKVISKSYADNFK
tara:strand:+ start:1970 stop:2248 length:279 start_codon:yes stop_codon:yes gene_type:complete